MKIFSVGAEFSKVYGQTDVTLRDEANSCFSLFYEPSKKEAKTQKQAFMVGNLLLIKLRTFLCLEEEQSV